MMQFSKIDGAFAPSAPPLRRSCMLCRNYILSIPNTGLANTHLAQPTLPPLLCFYLPRDVLDFYQVYSNDKTFSQKFEKNRDKQF